MPWHLERFTPRQLDNYLQAWARREAAARQS
jgi:hypothetical protein